MEFHHKVSNLHCCVVIKLSLLARWAAFFFFYLSLFIFLLLFGTGGASRPRRRVRYPKLVGQFVTVPGTPLTQLHLKIDTFILRFCNEMRTSLITICLFRPPFKTSACIIEKSSLTLWTCNFKHNSFLPCSLFFVYNVV